MVNKQTLRNFFSLYNKQCVRIELQFNDGTSTVYSDYDFACEIVEGIKAKLVNDIKQSHYCKEPKKREVKKIEEPKKEDKK